MHLLVWDEDILEIVGAYRLGEYSWIMSWLGKEGLYMYEPVSIINSYPNAAKDILVYFYTKYFQPSTSEFSIEKSFRATHPYIISKNTQAEFDLLFNE